MDREQLQQRLMGTFLAELEEHLRALDRDVLALEKSSDESHPELVDTLFRTVHSLKGASRSVGADAIEAFCHRLESALAAARDGQRAIDGDLIQQLFAAIDAMKDAGQRLRARQPPVGKPVQAAVPDLDAAGRGADETLQASAPRRPFEASSERPADAAVGPGPATFADFVRVSTDKLDALLGRSSELLVARHRAADGLEEAVLLRDAVRLQRTAWRLAERPLKALWRSRRTPRNGDGRNAAPHSPPLPRRAIEILERFGEDLKRLEHRAERMVWRLTTDHRGLQQAASALEEELLSARLVPFSEVGVGLERAVRDLARATSKEVDFRVEDGGVEIGRGVLDRLKDPLLHLVRNAVDHGLETPDERHAARKPPRGTITVTATLRGSTVDIVVSDDGRGVDLAAVRERARRGRMLVPDDDDDLLRLLFLPGFSTAPLVTEVSGRGIGLDIVKHQVESIHGHVEVSSTPGQGTRVSLTVPLMLATVRALLLAAGGQSFALPLANLVRLLRMDPEDFGSAAGRAVLLTDGRPVPIASLSGVLGIGEDARQTRGKLPIAIVASGSRQVAFIVDELGAEHELVVKSLGPRLSRVRHFAAATLLPTGRLALILNAADLVETALGRPSAAPARAVPRDPKPRDGRRRLLLAEDSVTTRSLEKSILEAAGYDVTAAVDGDEAWRLLQDKGADLVVADVEMPRMDGFALCEAIRGSRRFHDLPVVLVTAREAEGDKARGIEVGANAYLPKSTFDQRRLLEVIAQLL